MKLSVGNPEIGLNTNILDVEVPTQLLNNISTGWKEFDELFAGTGIMPSTVALVTGTPGSGKTTVCVQLADQITGIGNKGEEFMGGVCVYNGLEESFYQVKKLAMRLQLKHGFTLAYEPDVDELINRCEKIMALPENKSKQLFVMIDSLPCLELKREEGKRGRNKAPENQQIEAIQRITDWAKKSFAIVFVLGHVNKDGEFAGKQTLKHIVDVHFHLDMDRDHRSPSFGERIAVMEKNRTGVAGLYYPFKVGKHGFYFTYEHLTKKNK